MWNALSTRPLRRPLTLYLLDALFVLFLLALLALLGPARAADVPAKAPRFAAPAPVACTVNSCAGFYAGANITGLATSTNVFLNGIAGSLNGGGTSMGAQVGYRTWNGTYYLGAEVSVDYDVSSSVGALGSNPSDRFSAMELVKGGGSIGALLGHGDAPIVQFPAALQQSFESFYAILGAAQRYGQTGLASGVGAEFTLMPDWTMNLEYINRQWASGGASAAPGVSVPSDNLFRLLVNYNFQP